MHTQSTFYLLSDAQILSSTALIVECGVFRLVMKYATSPNVRKCTLNGAPPGAQEPSGLDPPTAPCSDLSSA